MDKCHTVSLKFFELFIFFIGSIIMATVIDGKVFVFYKTSTINY